MTNTKQREKKLKLIQACNDINEMQIRKDFGMSDKDYELGIFNLYPRRGRIITDLYIDKNNKQIYFKKDLDISNKDFSDLNKQLVVDEDNLTGLTKLMMKLPGNKPLNLVIQGELTAKALESLQEVHKQCYEKFNNYL